MGKNLIDTKREDVSYFLRVFLLLASTLGVAYMLWATLGPGVINQYGKFEKGELNAETAGQVGDSYGYINSLLTGLTLAGAVTAIILQTLELRYQRREMQESQDTWNEQREAMDRHLP